MFSRGRRCSCRFMGPPVADVWTRGGGLNEPALDAATAGTERKIVWLVPPGDIDSMIATVTAAGQNSEGCQERLRRARRYAEMFCRFEQAREAYAQLCQEVARRAS